MSATTPQRQVLATAASQIGYSRWSDPLNGTKYARETQPVFWPKETWLKANGIAYCDIFVTWVFWKALGEDFVYHGLPAAQSYNVNYRASKGGMVPKPPQPGDVLVFDWDWDTARCNHVGILEKVLPSGNYQTIEGNTSTGDTGSQSNGGRVARRVRKPSQVRYVIRPDWYKANGYSNTKEAPVTLPRWKTSELIKKLSKAQVTEIQKLLQSRGYNLGSYGADGVYGQATFNAVKAFQTKAGLASDGIAGPKTMAALKAPIYKASPKAPAKPSAPAFPLPRREGGLYYYGPASGPRTSVSGKYRNDAVPHDVTKDAHGKYRSKGLYAWQKKAGISADGIYGPVTEKKARELQRKYGVTVDGLIGPATWVLPWK